MPYEIDVRLFLKTFKGALHLICSGSAFHSNGTQIKKAQ
jgi:hypothetical protein